MIAELRIPSGISLICPSCDLSAHRIQLQRNLKLLSHLPHFHNPSNDPIFPFISVRFKLVFKECRLPLKKRERNCFLVSAILLPGCTTQTRMRRHSMLVSVVSFLGFVEMTRRCNNRSYSSNCGGRQPQSWRRYSWLPAY